MDKAPSRAWMSRRRFAGTALWAGASIVGGAGLFAGAAPAARADEQPRKGYFDVAKLPFHLQHEFAHAISCNNVVAKAEEIELDGKKQHAVLQRPGTIGWGTITFFLKFSPKLVGKDLSFFSTVGWKGKEEGEVVFSVEVNGDIIIDGGRSSKNTWAEVERKLALRTEEVRLTLMLDSIRGKNDFSFWWGEPQLRA